MLKHSVVPAFLAATLMMGSCAFAVTPLSPKEMESITVRLLKTWQPSAARINLIADDVFTRIRIARDQVDSFAKPIALGRDDPRFAKLTAVLAGIKTTYGKNSDPEPRTVIALTCADGSVMEFIGSRTSANGLMDFTFARSTDSSRSAERTRTPISRQLKALFPKS
jgi:hypothetical protein